MKVYWDYTDYVIEETDPAVIQECCLAFCTQTPVVNWGVVSTFYSIHSGNLFVTPLV